jgi:signal transduction histidine kinase
MEHMYQDKNLNIVLKDLKGLQFKGDAQDLEEMLGNLMDNACKWANNQVIVQGDKKGNRIYIRIQDDGPGIPGDKMHSVLKRGQRLDETVPGSGLGLGIVLDLSKLYNGDLKLDNCEEGGLCAELELPAADSSND